MKGYVYILRDGNGRLYVGSTDDLERRLGQHKAGHTQTTSRMKTPILILSQEYVSLEKARAVEYKIKKLKRKDYLEKMIAEGYIKLTL